MAAKRQSTDLQEFSAAEITALAHLYRGEVYRSTIWRTRLDTTTNWSVVTLGVALSITFSTPDASPLPLMLVGILIMLFLTLEARRYRYFNVWRARARWIERHFFVPILRDGDLRTEKGWHEILAMDYDRPEYHVSCLTAVARRVRNNYLWILLIQTIAFAGKLIVHPTPVTSVEAFVNRADVGPIPGLVVLALGALYLLSWVALALWITRADRKRAKRRGVAAAMG